MRTRCTCTTASGGDLRRWFLPVTVLLTAAVLMVGACSPAENVEGGDDSTALTYAVCMREQGVDDYPDPVDIDGEWMSRLPDDFDLEAPGFSAAERVCNSQQSGSGSSSPEDQQEVAEGLEAALEFAACMRDQGIDFPDPVVEEDGFSGPAGPLDDDVEGFDEASESCEEKVGATTTP